MDIAVDKVAVGERIATRRKALKMQAKQLGEIVGADPRQVWRYEHGESLPESPRLDAIARALGVTTRWLLSGEDPLLQGGLSEERVWEAFLLTPLAQQLPEDVLNRVRAQTLRVLEGTAPTVDDYLNIAQVEARKLSARQTT